MKKYIHGQLFEDENQNILSIEGTQDEKQYLLVNYIYIKDDKGWFDIDGKKFIKVIKKENGEWRNFSEQQLLLQKSISDVQDSSIYPFIQLISKDKIHKMRDCRETIQQFFEKMVKKEKIKSALKLMGIKENEFNDVGMIGSYQVGHFSPTSDIDLILCFDKERNYEIFLQIQKIISEGNALYGIGERARLNPLRFSHQGLEFCIHFSLPDDLIKRFTVEENSLGTSIDKIYEIEDISYSIYCPTILKTTSNDFLILYNGADRGIFKKGERLKVKGKQYEKGVVIDSYERNLA